MIPVSVSARTWQRLRATPAGPVAVVHAGPDAVYVDLGGACVGVLSRHAVAVPCGLRSRLDRLPDPAVAEVSDGALLLDGEPCVVGRFVDVAVPALPASLGVRATRPAPPPGDVAAMVGRGDGLTPYQDDVLCGWLALHRAAGVATPEVDAALDVALDAGRTTLLSATLLDAARHGEVVPAFAAWVRSLGSPAEPGAAAALARVGHTSGRGLLHGGRLALAGLTGLTSDHHRGAA